MDQAHNETAMRDAEIVHDEKAPCKILEAKFSPSLTGSGDKLVVRVKNTSQLEVLSISVKIEVTYDDGRKEHQFLSCHSELSIDPRDHILPGKEKVFTDRQFPEEGLSHPSISARMSAHLQRRVTHCWVKVNTVIFANGTYYGGDEVDVVRNMTALDQARRDVMMLRAVFSQPAWTRERMLEHLDELNARFKDFGPKRVEHLKLDQSSQGPERH
jgi:hypothetical protein